MAPRPNPIARLHRQSRKILTGLWYVPCLTGLLLLPTELSAQPQHPISVVRHYDEAEQRQRFDELMAEFGRNKALPPGYELQTLLALSHYPELRDIHIRFIYDDVNIPLSSRPHWATMLRSAQNRTYLVVIDSKGNGRRGDALLVKNQPFNAQVGIIGHELAHTVSYLDRSFFAIVGNALCQLTTCRIGFERATDRRLVEYGLGWQRYDHALFVRSRFLPNLDVAANAEGGGGAYMSPTELLGIMRNVAAYDLESGNSAGQTD